MKSSKSGYENSVEYDLFTSGFGLELTARYQLFNKLYESQISQIFTIKEYATNTIYILKAIDKSKASYWDLDAIKKINHPQIARVIDVFSTEKYIYLLKEYIKGVTLDEYIKKEGPLPEKTCAEIGIQICAIFKALHSIKPSPVIYRDLKPANLILTDDGVIKLIDLDSVRQYKQETSKDTVFIGTEGFAAPEQFGFGQTDNRTDIYTLGTTLYFLLTGKMPVTDKLKIKPVKEFRPDISRALNKIIEKCTMFSPESRYQDILELEADFISLTRWTLKGFLRKAYSKAIPVVLMIASAAVLYLAVENRIFKNDWNNPPLSTKQNNESSEFYDNTTILEAFWSGEEPQRLPAEFVHYYKQSELYKYHPDIFAISIKEWDPAVDHEQMSDRIHRAGGKLFLKADGYTDVTFEMRGDSMTAGDGSAQVYLAYIKNIEDLVSGVKYRIMDDTGHWIINEDVCVMRPEK